MKVLGIFVALSVIALSAAAARPKHHPLSDEKIAEINQKATTWKAGKNFQVDDWERVKKLVSGVLPYKGPLTFVKSKPHNEAESVPESFDSSEAWPECESITTIWDQSDCGSCWAVGAAGAMSDRICIHSNQTRQTFVSAEDLNACCTSCGYGCNGGYPDVAWGYWQENGIVTGGVYNAKKGCKDYSLEPCEHHVDSDTRPQCSSLNYDTPACTKTCYDGSLNYKESLTYGGSPVYLDNEKQIQLEILKNGPVEAAFDVMDDFPNYKSGVYQATSDNYIGGHAIRIVGWGVEDGTPYWLIANSWNYDWGLNGYVKFLRGQNHLDIEGEVVAALPVL